VMLGSSALVASSLGLAAAAFWGGGDFTGGLATRRASPFVTIAVAHGISLAALLAIVVAWHIPAPSPYIQFMGLLSGVVAGLGVGLFYKALSLGGMGLSAAIAGLISAAIPVMFSLFTEGLPHPVQILGILLAAIAIWLIASAPGTTAPKTLVMATLAGICFGVYFIQLKVTGAAGVTWAITLARVGSFTLAISVCAVQAALRSFRTAPPSSVAAATPPSALNRRTALFDPAFLALAVLTCVLDTGGNLFYTLATTVGRLDVAAVISSLYPAATILLAALLLKEKTTRTQTIGMLLALAAVVLISL
jgi:drug/metabolite transporter (DMT)-like permease